MGPREGIGGGSPEGVGVWEQEFFWNFETVFWDRNLVEFGILRSWLGGKNKIEVRSWSPGTRPQLSGFLFTEERISNAGVKDKTERQE